MLFAVKVTGLYAVLHDHGHVKAAEFRCYGTGWLMRWLLYLEIRPSGSAYCSSLHLTTVPLGTVLPLVVQKYSEPRLFLLGIAVRDKQLVEIVNWDLKSNPSR